MTTPKPDETQALIDQAREIGRDAGYDCQPKIRLMLMSLAFALARDHAIVERVTALLADFRSRVKQNRRLPEEYMLTLIDEALTPPAEQPPRSEPEMCGEYYYWGTSNGQFGYCPHTKGHEGSHGPLGNTQYARVRSETPAVAKCGYQYGNLICQREKWHDGDHSWTPPAAQPKPSPDRSAIVADLAEVLTTELWGPSVRREGSWWTDEEWNQMRGNYREKMMRVADAAAKLAERLEHE